MLKRICLAVAVLATAAMPALAADVCGSLPVAPAFPANSVLAAKPVDDARKDVLDAYHQVKTYQASLNSFRDCLLRLTKADQDAITEAKLKNDDNKIASIKQGIADRQAIYDKTVDSEQQVATDFNTLHTGHCARDTDAKVCPQPKKK
jgi:hypothetical protein